MFDEPKWTSFHDEIQKFTVSVLVPFNREEQLFLRHCFLLFFSYLPSPLCLRYKCLGTTGTWALVDQEKELGDPCVDRRELYQDLRCTLL